MILEEAQKEGSKCPCCATHSDKDNKSIDVWCKDLSSLSGTCWYMRENLWGIRLKTVLLRENEDLERLEEAIPAAWRHKIK